MLIKKSLKNAPVICFQTSRNSVEIKAKSVWEGEEPEIDHVLIRGFASTPTEDRYEDIVLPSAFSGTLERYMKNPVILLQHDSDKPIGQCLEYTLSLKGLEILADILHNTDDVMEKIAQGTLRGFSIGFRLLKWEMDSENTNKRTITDLELVEISVVSVPANPDTLFTMEKSLKDFFKKLEDGKIKDVEIVDDEPDASPTPETGTQNNEVKTDGTETGGENPPTDAPAEVVAPKGEEAPNAGVVAPTEDEVKALIEKATQEASESLAKKSDELKIALEAKEALENRVKALENELATTAKELKEANHLIDTTELKNHRKSEPVDGLSKTVKYYGELFSK